MNASPPIPAPPALRWREFRIRYLPVLFFAAALGGVCVLWQQNLTSPMLTGTVEIRYAQVSSPYAGTIAQLHVNRFQNVARGTPVAVLVPNDPRAALDVVRSELDILQAKLGPHLTQQRNETDYERLRLDWLSQRVQLATARVNLGRARNDLSRYEELHKQKLVSDEIYEIVLGTEQALAAEVQERSNLVSDISLGLKRLEILGAPRPADDPMHALMAALQTQEQKLSQAAAGTEPVTLVAPMAGTVSMVDRQAGENLSTGDPILTITATDPEHIISYLRQPIPFEPRVGMQMEVRTRALRGQSGIARITGVGSQFESITNSLAIARRGGTLDLGLPIKISLPPGLKVRPGELVDLTLVAEN
jgi:multidrug resistance efflux pump